MNERKVRRELALNLNSAHGVDGASARWVQRLGKFFESVPPERCVNSLEIPQRSPIRIIENYITVGTCVNYACAIDAPPVKLSSSLPRLLSNPLPSPIHRASLSTIPLFEQFLPSDSFQILRSQSRG